MLVLALLATLVGFAMLVVALLLGSLGLAIACIAVCVIGVGFLIADLLDVGRKKGADSDNDGTDDADSDNDTASDEQVAAGATAAPVATTSDELANAETTQFQGPVEPVEEPTVEIRTAAAAPTTEAPTTPAPAQEPVTNEGYYQERVDPAITGEHPEEQPGATARHAANPNAQ